MTQTQKYLGEKRCDLIKRKTIAAIFLSMLISGFFASMAIGQEQPRPEEEKSDATSIESTFEYQLENRPDPFVPFITETAAEANVNMDEIIDATGPLTGMQLFEPGQLTLVGLMKIGGEDVAMVEDFTGKGYILKEGIKIGRRGMVKDIAQNTVLIEETAFTRAGKKITSEIVMILKKEGEE